MVQFTVHWRLHLPPARLDEAQEIVPGTRGDRTARYMMTPSRGEIRGDQSMDSKTLWVLESILPSDSLPRRVPEYRLWKTRDEVSVGSGGEVQPNPRSRTRLDVAFLWIKDPTLVTRQRFRGHDASDRLSVAGTGRTIESRGRRSARDACKTSRILHTISSCDGLQVYW